MKLPDPITLLTIEDRANMAGLIDGEGSIYCAAVGPKRDKTCYPCLVVAMTDRDVIDWLAARWNSGKVLLHNHTNLRRPDNKWLPQYRVMLFGKRARLLCQSLLPYMRVKRRQAELVCEFPCDARIAPGFVIEHTQINVIRYRLRDAINSLNHRPRNPAARRASAI